MKKRYNDFYLFHILAVLTISFVDLSSAQINEIDALEFSLHEAMDLRDEYDQQKKSKIENLKELASQNDVNPENLYYINNRLIDEYEYYNFDDALYYIEKNIELAKKNTDIYHLQESKIRLTKLLVESGRYKEALDEINDIYRDQVPEHLLNSYFYCLKEIYSGLSYYSAVQERKSLYYDYYQMYKDSLSQLLIPNTEEYLRLSEKAYRDQRDIKEALKVNSLRLENLEMGNRLFSLVTFERSLLYELSDDIQKQKKYLMLSAQSDIIASVKDNASMTVLAMLFFKEGEVEKAHDYINFAVADAEFYNSRLRYVNISNILSVISKAYENEAKSQNKQLRVYLLLLIFFGFILLFSLGYIVNQIKKIAATKDKLKSTNKELKDVNKKLNKSNNDLKLLYNKLSESDKIKENYIGTFLNLYSDYINKLDSYRKLVRNYILTGKTKSLLELTKSKQVVGEELAIFYKNFDESFFAIHPNFIEEVNSLLQKEHQFKINKKNTLNTELRILALIRLGITESSKISKILRYS
ncbi:MAG: DUF6377 domain-containing protein, partial [Flavobacteriaceae bacterium]|nr:DUF6377 domain-containing protein [Flavobacteriaceae bacterium]